MGVYFIQGKETKRIKIGYSKDVKKRISTLQIGSGEKIELLLAVEGGEKEEMYLHDLFREYRTHGEWHEPADEIMSFIEGYKFCMTEKQNKSRELDFNEEEKEGCVRRKNTGFLVPLDKYTAKLLGDAAKERNMSVSSIVEAMLQCAIEVYYKAKTRQDCAAT